MILAEESLPAPTTIGEAFQKLENLKMIDEKLFEKLKKAVGFRNIAIHEYEKINWEIAYKITHDHLDDLKKFGKLVSQLQGL